MSLEELQAELQRRGLPSVGEHAELVESLESAISFDDQGEEGVSETGDAPTTEAPSSSSTSPSTSTAPLGSSSPATTLPKPMAPAKAAKAIPVLGSYDPSDAPGNSGPGPSSSAASWGGAGGGNAPINPDAKIYVDGLGNTDDAMLMDMFARHGPVVEVKTIDDRRVPGQKTGYGFVQFVNTDDALRAIKALDGQTMGDKFLRVRIAKRRSEMRNRGDNERPPPDGRQMNLYIQHIPDFYKTDDLKNLFAPFGNVVDSKVLVDPQGASRGVGFINYDTHEACLVAIDKMDNSVPPGGSQPMVVKFARVKVDRGGRAAAAPYAMPYADHGYGMHGGVHRSSYSARHQGPYPGAPAGPGPGAGAGDFPLFVYHVPRETTEDQLRDLFAGYGYVTDVRIPRDKQTGNPKGYAFVGMTTFEAAYNAVQYLNGFQFGAKYLKVEFKKGSAGEAQAQAYASGGAPHAPPPGLGGGHGGGGGGGYGPGGGGGYGPGPGGGMPYAAYAPPYGGGYPSGPPPPAAPGYGGATHPGHTPPPHAAYGSRPPMHGGRGGPPSGPGYDYY